MAPQLGLLGTCRAALGAVANFIGECHLSGIPLDEADKAMGETRQSYSKWWEGGVHYDNCKDGAAGEQKQAREMELKRRRLSPRTALDMEDYFKNCKDDAEILDRRRPKRLRLSASRDKKAKGDGVDQSEWRHLAKALGSEAPPTGYSIIPPTPCPSAAPIVRSAPITHPLQSHDPGNPASFLDQTLFAIQDMLSSRNRELEEQELLQSVPNPRNFVTRTVRSQLIDSLLSSHGDTADPGFKASLDVLSSIYKSSGASRKELGSNAILNYMIGNWVVLSRPYYQECLGQNEEGEFLYSLGRMSFDMFQPGYVKCSVQSTHSTIGRVEVGRDGFPSLIPKSLREEVGKAKEGSALCTYDIVVSLTIEPDNKATKNLQPQPTARQRALMTVKGYMLPDPTNSHRFTVWFTGGRLSPAILPDSPFSSNRAVGEQEKDKYGGFKEWQKLFLDQNSMWTRTWKEQARVMAAKLLLGADLPSGMDEDGGMTYTLNRPIGGHGRSFVDVLYLDEDILVTRGNHGTIYVMATSGVSQRFSQMPPARTVSPVYMDS